MNRNIPQNKIPHIIALAAITGLLTFAGNIAYAQTADSLLADPAEQSAFPQITAQPVDQTVPMGANVVLSVQAINADGYQWLCNGVLLDGQTSSVLIIQSAGINDVGLYSCEVSNGDQAVPTRAASVSVETTASAAKAGTTTAGTLTAQATAAGALAASATTSSMMAASMLAGGPIIVYGTPYLGGGSKGSCPGRYTGYVAYTKTVSQGWGWSPSGTVHTAADGSGRTDTKIEYIGAYGDGGCAQTTVTIPNPTLSPVYRFTIYFTNNVPATNAYPITLIGFNQ
jgi:hypothetical protein